MILGEESLAMERKGGVSIQEANAAIETLLDFKATEFTPEQIRMGMGNGFILLADGKGLKATQCDEIQQGMADAMASGLGIIPEEIRAKIPPENIESIALAVSFSCTGAFKIIAAQTIASYLSKEMDRQPQPSMEDFMDYIAHKVAEKLHKNQ